MYGSDNLIPVGGLLEGCRGFQHWASGQRRRGSPFRPFLPCRFLPRVAPRFPITAVVNLTPGEGVLAFAAR
eukprot:8070288-Lingulodinium_polyedra.AAC.1